MTIAERRAMLRHRYLLPLAACLGVLAGCEQLGLEDDDDGGAPPPVVIPPPELVVPEPLEPFPVQRVLFFRGTDLNDPGNPVDFIYSYLISTGSVLKQSSGLSAGVRSQPVALGNNRFTHSYIVLFENGRFYRGAGDTDVLTQISDFNQPICGDNDAFRLLQDGVGYVNSFLTTRTPGIDGLCETADDQYFRLELDAEPTAPFTAGSALAYAGVPINGPTWALDGLLIDPGTGNRLDVVDAQESLQRSFEPIGDTTLPAFLRQGDQLVWAIDGALYSSTSEALVGQETLPSIANLDAPTLDVERSAIVDNTLFTVDGTRLKGIDLSNGEVGLQVTLDPSLLPVSRPQISDSHVFVKGADNVLYRVPRDGSSGLTAWFDIADYGDVLGTFLVAGNQVYVSTRLSSDPDQGMRARLLSAAADANTLPRCRGELTPDPSPSPTSDETGCFSNARWIVMDRYTESGTGKVGILMQGKITETVVNNVTEQVPAQQSSVDPEDEEFLNAPEFTQFNAETGEPQIRVGSASGYYRLNDIGVIEDRHGLLSFIRIRDGAESRPDIAYFDLTRSNSFRIVTTTSQVEEGLIAATQP